MMSGVNVKKVILKDLTGNTITKLMLLNIVLAVVALSRDIALASFLGTSAEADSLLLAFFLPDVLGNNLIAASVGIACIPVFTQVSLKNDFDEFNDSVRTTVYTVFAFCLVITMISYIFRSDIIGIIGKGMSHDMKKLTMELFSIMLPGMILFPLITIGSSVSNVKNHFTMPAFAPVVFNLVFLVGIIIAYISKVPLYIAVKIIAFFISTGITMMLLTVYINIKRNGWVKIFTFSKINNQKGNFTEFIKIYVPYAAVLLVYQSVLYIEKYLASMLETGTIAGLNYAYRISQLPVWVFAAAVGTFSFPSIAKLKAASKEDELKKAVMMFLKLTFIIVFPLSLIIFILREQIVQILFQWGAFNNESGYITSDILAGYAVAITGQAMFLLSIRFFMAMKNMIVPVLIVIFSSTLNIVVNFLLTGRYGAAALGYGAAVGGITSGILLIILLNIKLDLKIQKKVKTIFKILLSSLPVMVVSLLYKKLWFFLGDQIGLVLKLLYGFAVFTSCVLIYYFCLNLLKVQFINSSVPVGKDGG